MSENYYTNLLYPVQDKALRLMEGANQSFYLTGGTALSRHYFHHRYSDDLDFFVNGSASFKREVAEMVRLFQKNFSSVEVGVSDENFLRLFIKGQSVELKIEFINDVPFYVGEKEKTTLFHQTDNWKNILANKLSALSRNEPKDIADLLFICMTFSFNWMEVIDLAKKKDIWVNEIEISKIIHEFDIARLEKIKWVQSPDYKMLNVLAATLSKHILEGKDNLPVLK